MTIYRDREHAGEVLAAGLARLPSERPRLLLAIPRGGIQVAAPMARALNLPLRVWLAGKIRAPGHPELALGALSLHGEPYLDWPRIRQLNTANADLDSEIARCREQLTDKARLYSGYLPTNEELAGHEAVVIDDGLATGSTFLAAVAALRATGSPRIIAALPGGPSDSVAAVERMVDAVICPAIPNDFRAVQQLYDSFEQVPTKLTLKLLQESEPPRATE